MRKCYAVFSVRRFLSALRYGAKHGYLFDSQLSDRQLIELVLYFVLLNYRDGMTAEDYLKDEYLVEEAIRPQLIHYLHWSKDTLQLRMRELFRVFDQDDHIEVYDISKENITLLVG